MAIILKDGTTLFTESDVLDFLESVGFDQPKMQMPELFELLAMYIHGTPNPELDEAENQIWDLEHRLEDAEWDYEDLKTRYDQLEDKCYDFETIFRDAIQRAEKQAEDLNSLSFTQIEMDILRKRISE